MSTRPHRQGGTAREAEGFVWRYRDVLLGLGILVLVALVVLKVQGLADRTVAGSVSVSDGDTLTLGEDRIRLRGIDAPEYDQVCERDGLDYPCGREATQVLRTLINGVQLTCKGWQKDRYDRLLAVCTAAGTDLNRRMVETGWAISYGGYEDAEMTARNARAGLWAGTFSRPQEWRAQKGDLADVDIDLHSGRIDLMRRLSAMFW